MYINKLHLRAFGKFVHKRLYLENKLNIIYGENEAGKSTVHNFIEAAFYGFDEDTSDILRHNKYKPWDSNLYKGSIRIKDNNDEKFLISRDFMLGTTQVFKKINGEPEMSEEEILCPGEQFFNMNRIAFNNTVSVRQLGNKTDKQLADELKNKIINLSKTRDESISIDRILQSLGSIKEEAGDEDNDKTLLGQYSLRLSELKSARENTLNSRRQVMFLAMEKKKTGSKIQELELQIEELKKELRDYELSIEKDKYLRAEPIKKELDEINEKLLDFYTDKIKEYSEKDYKEALNIESSLSSMYSQKRGLEVRKKEKEHELSGLLEDISNKIDEQFDIERLNLNFQKYQSNIVKINELKNKISLEKEEIISINIDEINDFLDSYQRFEDINRKMEMTNIFLDKENYEKMKSYKVSKIRNAALLTLLTAALIGGVWWSSLQYRDIIKKFIDRYYMASESVNISAAIVTGLIAIIFIVVIRPVLKKISNAKNEINSMDCEFADYTISMENMDKEKQEIIVESGCENNDSFIEKHTEFSAEKQLYEEKSNFLKNDLESLSSLEHENSELKNSLIKSLSVLGMKEINDENIKEANDAFLRKDSVRNDGEKLKNDIQQLSQDITKLDKEVSFEEKRLELILNSNGADDLDTFKKDVEYTERYNELVNNRDYKDSVLKKIIGDEDFEDLKNKTKNVNFYEVKKLDVQEYQLNIFKLNEKKSKLSADIDNMLKEIDEIENSTRSLAEIEEEIDFYENKISAFNKKIKVAEIAADKIVKISDSIKGDFMPLLRKSISDNFSYLTGGKYSEVVIDEDMNISVAETDNTERTIELENLSGGTLDQLYLSLRVGLGNILSGKKSIPLIFDDSFVQYDSNRLRNSLEMLSKESERRQVILFTCQEREAEIAKQMNIKFNYIKL